MKRQYPDYKSLLLNIWSTAVNLDVDTTPTSYNYAYKYGRLQQAVDIYTKPARKAQKGGKK